MKKFVSMETINMAFDDIPQVDYITVRSVTDSNVALVIYLKTSKRIKAGNSLDRVFQERAFVLGRMLDRSVNVDFIYATLFEAVYFKIKNWFT